jgi:hypothetical protein
MTQKGLKKERTIDERQEKDYDASRRTRGSSVKMDRRRTCR